MLDHHQASPVVPGPGPEVQAVLKKTQSLRRTHTLTPSVSAEHPLRATAASVEHTVCSALAVSSTRAGDRGTQLWADSRRRERREGRQTAFPSEHLPLFSN